MLHFNEMQYQGSYYLLNKLKILIKKYQLQERISLKAISHCQTATEHFRNKSANINVLNFVNTQTGEVTKSAYVSNVYTCDNSWTCPICSARKLNYFADKINRLIIGLDRLNQRAIMLTLKIPHHIGQSAAEVLTFLKTAKTKLVNCAAWQRMCRWFKINHSVTSNECTFSKNGFHFHQHILLFLNMDAYAQYPEKLISVIEECNQFLKNFYIQYIGKDFIVTSTSDPLYLSVDKNNNPNFVTSGAYITASSELTAANYKTCRANESRQMFELLDSDDEIDKLRFLDYAMAVSHSKRVRFSNNANKYMISLEEYDELIKSGKLKSKKFIISDEEVVCTFTGSSWSEISHSDLSKNHIANIIQASIYGFDAVTEYCTIHKLPLPIKPIGQFIRSKRRRLNLTESIFVAVDSAQAA